MNLTYAYLPQRLGALIDRERRTRFAGGVVGYLWAYLTPLAWIAFVVILFKVLDRAPPLFVGAEIFVASGFLPYLVFRQTVTSLSRTIPANRYLLYVRPVSVSDLLLSSALLEGFNVTVTALVVFGFITLAFNAELPVNFAQVVIGLVAAWILGTGIGRFVAVVGMYSDSFARAVPIILRPMFWLSGIFYTATELPGAVRDILWFSPLLHITEAVREGYFLGYLSPISNLWYPCCVAAIFFLVSIPIEGTIMRSRLARRRL